MRLSINSFRAFNCVNRVNIAPLTILVGENSAGKTSFLAANRLIYELLAAPELASFNKEPFLLGAYDQIAHLRGGRSGRAPKFVFKIETQVTISRRLYYFPTANKPAKNEVDTVSCTFCFINEFSIPKLSEILLEFGSGKAHIKHLDQDNISIEAEDTAAVSKRSFRFTIKDEGIRSVGLVRALSEAPLLLIRDENFKTNNRSLIEMFDAVGARFRALRHQMGFAVYASAPVRTEPDRAYTPIDANPTPQGRHIPYLLARLKKHDISKWNDLKNKIDQFGQSAGIFGKIDVKKLGNSESDPFQIFVDFGGPRRNIIDVGYGVSQVLPVITEVMSREGKTLFLFQQPEVHLHPQAQAALGTFFATETARGVHSFIIESHSDYVIDRVRMAVKDKIIDKDKVSIIYFQRGRLESNLHEIGVDETGNIINSPPGYRTFFLQEEMRSIGI